LGFEFEFIGIWDLAVGVRLRQEARLAKSIPMIVYGASGHGKVVADAAVKSGLNVIGFGDDDPAKRGSELRGLKVLFTGLEEVQAEYPKREIAVLMGIGDNANRRKVFEECERRKLYIGAVVHPNAVIGSGVGIGPGTVIFAGVVVNPDSRIGMNVILNTACSIDHDNVIGAHAHISPGARLGGTVRVGEGTHIGIGAVIKNNVTIGAWAIVGAGAVVVHDVPDGVVVVGNPTRTLRRVNGADKSQI
jgi:sugar O-acyltransferase (sialic acid O-acetyltransferase NeuD family)